MAPSKTDKSPQLICIFRNGDFCLYEGPDCPHAAVKREADGKTRCYIGSGLLTTYDLCNVGLRSQVARSSTNTTSPDRART